MFSLSRHARAGPAQLFSEVMATFGLVLIIGACVRRRPNAVPWAVASYISAAYATCSRDSGGKIARIS